MRIESEIRSIVREELAKLLTGESPQQDLQRARLAGPYAHVEAFFESLSPGEEAPATEVFQAFAAWQTGRTPAAAVTLNRFGRMARASRWMDRRVVGDHVVYTRRAVPS